MKLPSFKKTNQSGLVSIVVTLIVILIISLIVLGFARLARRNQTQTLDRQLNTQALYAAETGINDAIKALADNDALGDKSYTKCGDGSTDDFIAQAGLGTKNVLNDEGQGVSYSCLLVDPAPVTLTYQNVPSQDYVVVPVKSANGNPINRIIISWENPGNSGAESCDPVGSVQLPPAGGWTCTNPLLRMDIVPGFATDNITEMRDDVNVSTFFAYPDMNTGGSATYLSGASQSHGSTPPARCDGSGSRRCTLAINTSSVADPVFYLRLFPIYRSATIDVSAIDSSGNLAELTDAQVVIDATGKAQDVLKRIQVHASLFKSNKSPFFALESGSILCKRLEADNTSALIDTTCIPPGAE